MMKIDVIKNYGIIISNDSSIIIGVRFLVHRISVSSLEIL